MAPETAVRSGEERQAAESFRGQSDQNHEKLIEKENVGYDEKVWGGISQLARPDTLQLPPRFTTRAPASLPGLGRSANEGVISGNNFPEGYWKPKAEPLPAEAAPPPPESNGPDVVAGASDESNGDSETDWSQFYSKGPKDNLRNKTAQEVVDHAQGVANEAARKKAAESQASSARTETRVDEKPWDWETNRDLRYGPQWRGAAAPKAPSGVGEIPKEYWEKMGVKPPESDFASGGAPAVREVGRPAETITDAAESVRTQEEVEATAQKIADRVVKILEERGYSRVAEAKSPESPSTPVATVETPSTPSSPEPSAAKPEASAKPEVAKVPSLESLVRVITAMAKKDLPPLAKQRELSTRQKVMNFLLRRKPAPEAEKDLDGLFGQGSLIEQRFGIERHNLKVDFLQQHLLPVLQATLEKYQTFLGNFVDVEKKAQQIERQSQALQSMEAAIAAEEKNLTDVTTLRVALEQYRANDAVAQEKFRRQRETLAQLRAELSQAMDQTIALAEPKADYQEAQGVVQALRGRLSELAAAQAAG